MNNQKTAGYICPATKEKCNDECCVSAEQCHLKESEKDFPRKKKQSSLEWYNDQLDNLQYNPLEKNGYVNAKNRLLKQAKERFEQEIKRAFVIGGGVEYHEINLHADEYFIEEFNQ
jgi:hypothetical protein